MVALRKREKFMMRNKIPIYISLTAILTLCVVWINELLLGNDSVIASFIGIAYFAIVVAIVLFFLSLNLEKMTFHPLMIYILVLSFFYLLGFLNFSTYRSTLNNIDWIVLIIISLTFLCIGYLIAILSSELVMRSKVFDKSDLKFNYKLYYSLMGLMSILAIFLNFRYGFPIFNPSNRFNVPAMYQYLVEFTVPATLCFLSYEIFVKNKILKGTYSLFWSILISASLGYRNQILILLLGYVLLLSYLFIKSEVENKYSTIKRALTVSILVSALFVFMGVGFINRQENSKELVNWHDFISYFEVQNYEYITPLMPIHLSAREAMGVTEVAFDRNESLTYLLQNNSLFFMDLVTLLPGQQPSAGSVLGKIVNLSDTTSLTIGIIGGLYVSGGIFFLVLGMAIIGFLNSFFWNLFKKTNNVTMFSLSIITLTYSLELLNRGLFKPMYIIVMIFPLLLFVNPKKKRNFKYE